MSADGTSGRARPWITTNRVDAGDLARAADGAMRKYRYRRNLPHLQKDDRPVFISFNTNGRWELPPTARDIAMECVRFQHRKKFWLHAAVVMPEHVHMVFTVGRDPHGPISVMEILQNVKSVSSRQIKKALPREGRVWQEESFDHVLRSEEKLDDRIEYLRQNPVRRGLCCRPEEYRWLWVNPEEMP